MLFRFISLGCGCALVLTDTLAGAPTVPALASLALELRAEALVNHTRIALADLVVLPANPAAAGSLGRIDAGRAPRAGYTERLSRAQLELLIRRHGAAEGVPITWSGAASVAVRLKTQTVKAQDLEAAATQAGHAEFADRYAGLDIAVAAPTADLEVPTGPWRLRARALKGLPLAPRVPLWLDVIVDGAVYRSILVPLLVTLRQPVYVARRSFERGAWSGVDDFEVRDENVAGVDALPVAPAGMRNWRLRQGIKAGQVLSRAVLSADGAVMRGDQVRLVVRSGPIGIETGATAMAEAVPGQLVAVRPSGATDIVTGRLGAATTVIVE